VNVAITPPRGWRARVARTASAAAAAPVTINAAMSINAYWLNGSSTMGMRSGRVSVAQRFCSGRRMPVISHGSRPAIAAATPTSAGIQAASGRRGVSIWTGSVRIDIRLTLPAGSHRMPQPGARAHSKDGRTSHRAVIDQITTGPS
jgi:hypothetical protein